MLLKKIKSILIRKYVFGSYLLKKRSENFYFKYRVNKKCLKIKQNFSCFFNYKDTRVRPCVRECESFCVRASVLEYV